MSLRLKIALSLAGLAGIIASLAAAGAYVTAADQLEQSIDETLIAQARAVTTRQGTAPRGGPGSDGRLVPRGNPRAFGMRCPELAELPSVRSVLLIDADGDRVESCIDGATDVEPTAGDLAIAAGDGGEYRLRRGRIDGEPARVITMAFPQGGALLLARDTDEAGRVLDGLRVRLVLIALAGIAAAGLAGFALATRIVKPIRRLTSTAEHIAATRDLTTPVPPGGNDEIGSLSASFTTMVASLAQSQEQQQRLISDASHEMRTPLTSLRTNLEFLERAEQGGAVVDPDDRRAVIGDLQFETSELTSLLTELVELATDRSGNEEAPEETDFVSLCRGIAERSHRRTGRPVRLLVDDVESAADDADAVIVYVRPHMIERALSNLIDNAIKYSPAGSPIDVSVTGSRVEVRDQGPGIAADDLPRIFDRFYRATSARTEPGSGLGLAIVSQIVESHGGTVFAANTATGAAVGFDLPAVDEQEG